MNRLAGTSANDLVVSDNSAYALSLEAVQPVGYVQMGSAMFSVKD